MHKGLRVDGKKLKAWLDAALAPAKSLVSNHLSKSLIRQILAGERKRDGQTEATRILESKWDELSRVLLQKNLVPPGAKATDLLAPNDDNNERYLARPRRISEQGDIGSGATAQPSGLSAAPVATKSSQGIVETAESLKSTVFVGRGLQLTMITNWAGRDDPSIFWITGEAGIGKSALAWRWFEHGSESLKNEQRFARKLWCPVRSDESVAAQVAAVVQHFPRKERVLFVFDAHGATETNPSAPTQAFFREDLSPKIKILITNRIVPNWLCSNNFVRVFPLTGLELQEAKLLWSSLGLPLSPTVQQLLQREPRKPADIIEWANAEHGFLLRGKMGIHSE